MPKSGPGATLPRLRQSRRLASVPLLLVLGLAVALALSACGGSSSNSSNQKAVLSSAVYGPSTSAECQKPPVDGGTLVYERQAATESLNPLETKNGNGDIFAIDMIFDTLVTANPDGSTGLKPALATSWKSSDGDRVWTFHLRSGVKFSNGEPLTAEDVAWSLNRFGNPTTDPTMSAVAVGYGNATVVNAATVKVQLTRPVAAFLYNISIFPAAILPKNLVLKEGAAFYKNPVGTGPFKVSQFVQGSHLTLVKNPDYWQTGKPYLNTVRFNFETDANGRQLALQSGAAQEMDGLPFSAITSLEKDHSVDVQAAKVPQEIGLWLNHSDKPLASLDVRQAMQYALNRTEMNSDIFNGLGEIPNSVIMGNLLYNASSSVVKPYPYDVAKAKALMKAAGYAKGFNVSLQYPAGYDYYNQLALLIQQEYAAIGITVKLDEEDPATNTANWSTGSYQMVFPFASFTSDVSVPDEYADFLADYNNGLKGFEMNWRDPAIQAQVLKFESTTSNAARAAEWPKIQQALMTQTPSINVMDDPFVNAHAADVCGTDINALGVDQLEDTWIAAKSS
jgi:peptide/nickel transport system substrate-binding protein